MNSHQIIPARTIGSAARSTLNQNTRASVLGVTSRGIFLLAPSKQIVFLSYEKYCGPLSANLTVAAGQTLPPVYGQSVIIQAGFLSFPNAGTRISLSSAQTWYPPHPPSVRASIAESIDLLKRIARRIHPDKTSIGLAPFLRHLLGSPNPVPLPEDLQPAFTGMIELTHLFDKAIRESLPAVIQLLGLGRGLTPSGDDFITGMLLFLNRMPGGERFAEGMQQFNQLLIEAAIQKTTTLSANIIECAASASADERLIIPVDGLIRAEADPKECAALLESYGHSSGIDALTGMAAALFAFANLEASH